MHIAVKPINEIFQVNNYLFGLAFEGIDEKLARKQLQPNANSVTWLLGHTAAMRFDMLGLTGTKEDCPWGTLFDSSITEADQSKYPDLNGIKSVWDDVSAKITQKLPEIDEARLGQPLPFKLPTKEQNVLSGLAFIMMHESYHVGQISTQRRLLGIDSLFDLVYAQRRKAQQ